MGWKNWPTWVKGGVIGGIISIGVFVFLFFAVALFCFPFYESAICSSTSIVSKFYFYFPNFYTIEIIGIFLLLGFIIGAIIGGIVGKIRKR